MAHGHGFRVFSVTIASGATLSSEIDLGRLFQKVYIDPTGANSEVRYQAAEKASGTYRQVYLPQAAGTSTVQANIWKVASAVSGGVIEGPTGLRYLKIETTAAVSDGATLKLICGDF